VFSAQLSHISLLVFADYCNSASRRCIILIEVVCSLKQGTCYSVFQIVSYSPFCTHSNSLIRVNEENGFKWVSMKCNSSTIFLIKIHLENPEQNYKKETKFKKVISRIENARMHSF